MITPAHDIKCRSNHKSIMSIINEGRGAGCRNKCSVGSYNKLAYAIIFPMMNYLMNSGIQLPYLDLLTIFFNLKREGCSSGAALIVAAISDNSSGVFVSQSARSSIISFCKADLALVNSQ